MTRPRFALPVVMAVAVALRVVWIPLGSGTARFMNVDSASYLAFAAALPGVLGNPSTAALDPSLQRSPGYPLLVWISGASGGSPIVLLVTQCLIGGVVVVGLTHMLADRMAGPRAAIIAAAVVAADPASIGHSLLVGTETFFTAALLATVLLVWSAYGRAGEAKPIAVVLLSAGGVLGVASLVRPQVVYLVPAAALGAASLVFTVRRGSAGVRAGVVGFGLVVVGALVVGGPWVVRNSMVAERWLVSTAQAQNLADLGAACMEAERTGVAWWPEAQKDSWARHDRARERFEREYGSAARIDDVLERDSAWSRAGRDAVATHPLGCAQVVGSSLVRATVGPSDTLLVTLMGPDAPGGVGPALRITASAILVLQLLLATVGTVVLGLRRRWAVVLTLASPIVVYLVTSAGPQLYARFRVPVVPYVAVLTAFGAVALFDRLSGRSEGHPSTRSD